MLRNKSRLEALHGVKELDNQAAERIWGGTFDPENLPPGASYIGVGPGGWDGSEYYVDCKAESWRTECGGSGEKPSNEVYGTTDWGRVAGCVVSGPFSFLLEGCGGWL